jgi:hypothetical protein
VTSGHVIATVRTAKVNTTTAAGKTRRAFSRKNRRIIKRF